MMVSMLKKEIKKIYALLFNLYIINIFLLHYSKDLTVLVKK